MRVLVCGGRDFIDIPMIHANLNRLHKLYMFETLIEGDAKGVDRIAGYWARKNKITNLKFPADWETFGRSAGFVRNRQMLIEGKPDLVVAFPGGKGTAMMIRLAKQENVEVIEITV